MFGGTFAPVLAHAVWFTGHHVSNRPPINTGTGLCCLNTKFKWRSAGDTLLSLSHGRNRGRDTGPFRVTSVVKVYIRHVTVCFNTYFYMNVYDKSLIRIFCGNQKLPYIYILKHWKWTSLSVCVCAHPLVSMAFSGCTCHSPQILGGEIRAHTNSRHTGGISALKPIVTSCQSVWRLYYGCFSPHLYGFKLANVDPCKAVGQLLQRPWKIFTEQGYSFFF